MGRILRDPISGFSHLAGALLGITGLVFLIWKSSPTGTAWHFVSFTVFTISLVLLYSASALYHLWNVSNSKRGILRRIDHTMIFVLIAGSYTPFCLLPLRGPWGWSMLGVIWFLALGGLFMSLFWLNTPRFLSTGLYLLMGWIMVVAVYPLLKALSIGGIVWLLAGGLLYTFGAVIYTLKRPDPFPHVFGFHEIWHLFVLAGSTCHFLSVATLLPR